MAVRDTCRTSRLRSNCPIELPVRQVRAGPARPRRRGTADNRPCGIGRPGRRARRRRRHDHRSRRRPGAADRRRYAGDGPSEAAGRVLRQGSQRVHEAARRRQAGAPGVRPAADRPLRADAGVRPPAGRNVRQRRDHQARLRSRLHPLPLQVPRSVQGARTRRASRGPRPVGLRGAAGANRGRAPAGARAALARWDDNRNGRISCAEARRHGIAPVPRGHPAYGHMRDGDNDGVVCE